MSRREKRLDDQVDVYRSYSPASAQAHWGGDEVVDAPTADDVVGGLLDGLARSGGDALNLRVHVPGVSPDAAREQIIRLGDEVLGPLRAALGDEFDRGKQMRRSIP